MGFWSQVGRYSGTTDAARLIAASTRFSLFARRALPEKVKELKKQVEFEKLAAQLSDPADRYAVFFLAFGHDTKDILSKAKKSNTRGWLAIILAVFLIIGTTALFFADRQTGLTETIRVMMLLIVDAVIVLVAVKESFMNWQVREQALKTFPEYWASGADRLPSPFIQPEKFKDFAARIERIKQLSAKDNQNEI